MVIDVRRLQFAADCAECFGWLCFVAHTAFFRHLTSSITTDESRIIGTTYRQDNLFAGAIHGFHGDCLVQRVTNIECLNIRIGIVRCVGPIAIRVQGKPAIRCWIVIQAKSFEFGRSINVCCGQFSGQNADRTHRIVRVINPTFFWHPPTDITTNHCRIVGATDGHGDQFRGAVNRGNHDRISVVLATNEFIVRGVHGVSPCAPCIDAELTVAVGTRHVDLSNKARRTVYVGDCQVTAKCLQ